MSPTVRLTPSSGARPRPNAEIPIDTEPRAARSLTDRAAPASRLRAYHKTLDEFDFAFQPDLDPAKSGTWPASPFHRCQVQHRRAQLVRSRQDHGRGRARRRLPGRLLDLLHPGLDDLIRWLRIA